MESMIELADRWLKLAAGLQWRLKCERDGKDPAAEFGGCPPGMEVRSVEDVVAELRLLTPELAKAVVAAGLDDSLLYDVGTSRMEPDCTSFVPVIRQLQTRLRLQGTNQNGTNSASNLIPVDRRPRRSIDAWLEKLEEYESQAMDNPGLTEAQFARSINEKPDTVRDGLERARVAKESRTATLKRVRDERR